MNLREIKLYDSNNKYDETDTIAALDKQRLIIEEFRKWIWLDDDRIWEVEEVYNKMFSDLDKKTYSGREMLFPEMSESFELYDFQKAAVERIINEKNTLLAFDVGSGKTYIMIAAAMKMRQMGMSRKNMFVVPNNIVGQWEKIFTDLKRYNTTIRRQRAWNNVQPKQCFQKRGIIQSNLKKTCATK